MKKTYAHQTTDGADFTLNYILDVSNQGFWDWNAKTGYVYRSVGWFRMLGYEYKVFKDDVFTWENIIHPEDYERVMHHFEAYIRGESMEYKIEYRCKKSDDSYLWIEDSAKIVQKAFDGSVVRMIGAHTDIHETKLFKEMLIQKNEHLLDINLSLENLVQERTEALRELNKKLNEQIQEVRYYASHDSLTGIVNRREFERLIEKEIYRAKRYSYPLSMLVMDIDNFKVINDKYGHKTGDQVLTDLVSLIQKIIRESDIMARWGGEEFVIVFPENTISDTVNKAEILREAIYEHIFASDLHITCSFGVTTYIPGDTKDTVFIRCDQALYDAKNVGKNKVQVR